MNTSAFDFFFEHAGYSWHPATESQFAGRVRDATGLALAEAIARRDGYQFRWARDTHEDRSGIDHNGPLWVCVMYNEQGEFCQSLGGIDLGAGGWPASSNPYARVIQAELAMEQLL